MAEAEGQYQVYAMRPTGSHGPQFIVTALYRTPPTRSSDFGSDRAEWFVVMADDPKPLRAQIIGFKNRPTPFENQITELLRSVALDEATLEVRRYQQGNSITVGDEDSGKDLFVRYWIRGVCTEQLKKIAKMTYCPALREALDMVFQLPQLIKGDFPPRESDTE